MHSSLDSPPDPPGASPPRKRKLTAILHADVVGFSRLMGVDEAGTHRALGELRRAVDPLIATHGGRIVGTAGDSLLADFSSVVDALNCAVEMQRAARTLNDPVPPERRLELRIGVNLGDVIVDGDDIFGDGVNIAARLEALAQPGTVCISHMWTAPSLQGVLQCFDQIACVHMSGLFVRSHMNAGQDGFRDESFQTEGRPDSG